MRRFRTLAIAIMVHSTLAVCSIAHADMIAGTWTKTNHPDTTNILVFYSDSEVVKVVGYEQVGGVPAYWHGEGTFRDGRLELRYQYSPEATPSGWEPEGRMLLTLSSDGGAMHGTATSRSGNWSETIAMRRIFLE